MNTNSPKNDLNSIDFLHWLKNVSLIVFPLVLQNIEPIENWFSTNLHIDAAVVGIVFGAIVKLIEYYLKNNNNLSTNLP